jgi:nuclear GTP-binding protein
VQFCCDHSVECSSFAVQVGNTPGVTKSVQEVHLDKHIKLLDSPGVVFADADDAAAAALRNAIKVERLDDPGKIQCIIQCVVCFTECV